MVIVNASKTKVYVMLFVFVAFAYIAYLVVIISKSSSTNEHFVSEEAYEARMHVISVFDGYLHRNPTPSEIEKYSKHKNEQDILTAVMQDNHSPTVANEPNVFNINNTKEEHELYANNMQSPSIDSETMVSKANISAIAASSAPSPSIVNLSATNETQAIAKKGGETFTSNNKMETFLIANQVKIVKERAKNLQDELDSLLQLFDRSS